MAKHGIRNNKAPGAYRPIYKEGNQSKYCNYSGTNLVYVGSKLLIIMMHLGLKEAVDTVYRRTVLGWG